MNLARIAENWNGQVTKLYDWTINRLESAADRGDVKVTQTDSQLQAVKPRKFAEQEEYHEIQH